MTVPWSEHGMSSKKKFFSELFLLIPRGLLTSTLWARNWSMNVFVSTIGFVRCGSFSWLKGERLGTRTLAAWNQKTPTRSCWGDSVSGRTSIRKLTWRTLNFVQRIPRRIGDFACHIYVENLQKPRSFLGVLSAKIWHSLKGAKKLSGWAFRLMWWL